MTYDDYGKLLGMGVFLGTLALWLWNAGGKRK